MLQVRTQWRWTLAVALAMTTYCGHLAGSAVCVTVIDYADLPLDDAWVTVTNLQTNKLSNTRTGHNGDACVSHIPEGLYSVEVGLTGFLNVRYYPVRVTSLATEKLKFRLPFGEITEGLLATEAILSGTLRQNDRSVEGAQICILTFERDLPLTCAVTNDLGEYALTVVPGNYRVVVTRAGRIVQRSTIELPTPGMYRDQVTLHPPKEGGP